MKRQGANPLIEARELPYVTHIPADGRLVVLMGYYDADEEQFYTFLQSGGKIAVIPSGEMLEGRYIAQFPAKPDIDRQLPLSETLVQHFSFQDVIATLLHVERDLINGLASLQKYFILLHFAKEYGDVSYMLMISTEVEYAVGNHRAFYDRLHGIVCALHPRYHGKSVTLPDSFAKLAEKDGNELDEKYGLPHPLIEFYHGRKRSFLKLRKIRDNIFHHGHSLEIIFLLPDGFALRMGDRFAKELRELGLWEDALLKPNGLCSILPILEYLTRDMSEAAESLASSLLQTFEDLPTSIAAGHHVFFRSTLTRHLTLLDKYRKQHWFDPAKILGVVGGRNAAG